MSGTTDPMAMPMLGQEQQYGFGGGATDPYLMMLMRRRALAEALQKQQPQQPMTHPLQVLGTIAEKGVGAWQQGKIEREYLDYAQKQQQAERALMQEALGGMGQSHRPAPVPMAVPTSSSATSSETGSAPAVAPAQSGPRAFRSPGTEAMIKETATRHGVPVDWARALVMQESGGNPGAVGKAGEVGLSQIMPSTARNPGFGMQGVDPASLRDPAANLDFGMQYLAARAKSAGLDLSNPDHVAQALKLYNGGGDPNYVANVSRHMGGGAQAPSVGQQSSPPSTPAVAPQQDQRADMVERARRLMATGNPRATQAAMQILALAKAMPEPPNWTTTNIGGQVVAVNPRDPSQMRVLGASNDHTPKPQAVFDQNRAAGAPYAAVAATPERHAQELAERAAGATRVQMTNDQRGEGAFSTERGKQLAGQVDEWQNARTKGAQLMTQFANFERANRAFTSGAAAGSRIAVGKWAQLAGIPDNVLSSAGLDKNAVASAEEMRSITSRMMTDMIGKGGFPAQNFSNADREELMRSLSSVDNTPEGNARIIAIGRAAAERQIEIGKAWAEWRQANGTSPASAEKFMEDRMPAIIERNVIAPVQVASPEEAIKLAPGTRFIDPSGQVRVVPGGAQ